MSNIFTTDTRVTEWIRAVTRKLYSLDPKNELIVLAGTLFNLVRSHDEAGLKTLLERFKVDDLKQLEIEILALLEDEVEEIRANPVLTSEKDVNVETPTTSLA